MGGTLVEVGVTVGEGSGVVVGDASIGKIGIPIADMGVEADKGVYVGEEELWGVKGAIVFTAETWV
jgi:hypothetical protein